MEISEDTWLSDRFGHRVFSVRTAGALSDCASPATYQARIDVADIATVEALERAGMRVVNVMVTLRCDPAAVPGEPREAAVEVRDADPEHDLVLLDVAARAFRYSRFHLDPAIPNQVADRIKRDWVRSYLDGVRGEQLLVAVADGEPVGFLAVLAREHDGRRVRVIDLVGVAPEARGSGVGTALVRRFHEESRGHCAAVEVGTQLANVEALQFYERLGYRTTRAAFDLHLHT